VPGGSGHRDNPVTARVAAAAARDKAGRAQADPVPASEPQRCPLACRAALIDGPRALSFRGGAVVSGPAAKQDMSAAEKAEARRQKILASADQRMSKLLSQANSSDSSCMEPRLVRLL
jgi:hypothetical protein